LVLINLAVDTVLELSF